MTQLQMTEGQELFVRAYAHKVSIVGAYEIEKYMQSQCTGEVKIPEFMAQDVILNKLMDIIHGYIAEGTLEEHYAEAYEAIGYRLPDSFISPIQESI